MNNDKVFPLLSKAVGLLRDTRDSLDCLAHKQFVNSQGVTRGLIGNIDEYLDKLQDAYLEILEKEID